jgi:hypothetical protein
MIKELVFLKDMNEILIRNIMASDLTHKLLYLIECGDEELVDKSVGVIQEFMNRSNVLIFHIINCGYINALKNRVSHLKWKTYSTNSTLQLIEKTKFNNFGRNQIDKNKDKINGSRRLPRIISRAILHLFCTECSQLSAFVQCLVPLIQHLLTCPDDEVKHNVLSSISMMDRTNSYVNNLIVENLSHHLLYLMTNSNDKVLVFAIQSLNQIIRSDRRVNKQKSFLIQIVQNCNKLLNENRNANVVKEIVDCIITITESLPMGSKFFSEYREETVLLIDSLLKSSDKLKVDSYFAIQKVLETFSMQELEYLFHIFDLMEAIKTMLETNDSRINSIGLELISRVLKTSSRKQSLSASVKKLLFDKGVNVLLDQLSCHNNKIVSESAERILITCIDRKLSFDEDIKLLPTSKGNEFKFGIDFNFKSFKF